MADNKQTTLSIIGVLGTPNAGGPYPMPMIIDGVIVGFIPVPEGTSLVISDVSIADAGTFANIFLQQDNGGGPFNIGIFKAVGSSLVSQSELYSPKTGWVVKGGPLVKVGVMGATPADAGGGLIFMTMRAYRES